jgi:hypothetical protein
LAALQGREGGRMSIGDQFAGKLGSKVAQAGNS